MHLIRSQQLTSETIFSIFKGADNLRASSSGILEDKILAALFYEPSTRTRLSFESAMLRLGGEVIGTENAKEFSSAVKGESLEDSIRIISKYSDIIVLRHYEEGASERAAYVSSVPVINAGDGSGQHPTQALLDMYTIWKELGRVEDINVVLSGDLRYGRTVRSLCYLLGKFDNMKLTFVSPENLSIKEDIKDYLRKHEVNFKEEKKLDKVLPEADIVYMTRIQKERMSAEEYVNAKKQYQINEGNLGLLRRNARLLHPLPHVDEISLPVEIEQNDERVGYFKQAENGLYVRMALLAHLLD